MSKVAELAAETERGVSLFRQPGGIFGNAVEGNCSRAGEERAAVLVGGPPPAVEGQEPPLSSAAGSRFGFLTPGRILGQNQGQGPGGEVMGAAGGGAES